MANLNAVKTISRNGMHYLLQYFCKSSFFFSSSSYIFKPTTKWKPSCYIGQIKIIFEKFNATIATSFSNLPVFLFLLCIQAVSQMHLLIPHRAKENVFEKSKCNNLFFTNVLQIFFFFLSHVFKRTPNAKLHPT